MPTHHRTRQPALVVRCCALCGRPRAIRPASQEHRMAHQTREIAFVCQDCADTVRMEVQVAAETMKPPKVLA